MNIDNHKRIIKMLRYCFWAELRGELSDYLKRYGDNCFRNNNHALIKKDISMRRYRDTVQKEISKYIPATKKIMSVLIDGLFLSTVIDLAPIIAITIYNSLEVIYRCFITQSNWTAAKELLVINAQMICSYLMMWVIMGLLWSLLWLFFEYKKRKMRYLNSVC